VSSLEGVVSAEDFEPLANLPWEEDLFKNVEIKVGNPLATPHDTVKCVLVEPKDKAMGNSIQKFFVERFPELKTMDGEFDVIEQTTRRKGAGGKTADTHQKVIKIQHDGSIPSIWKGLDAVRQECKEDKAVVIHHVEALSGERLKKLTQAVFRGEETRVTICTTEARRKKESEAPAPAKKKERKERETLALTIDLGDRHFRDVLKGVRQAVGGEPERKNIQALRSTKEDKLLIVLDKNEDARAKVQKLLASQNLTAKQVGPRERPEVIHLRGLDGLASREEVLEALESAVGQDTTTKVGPMRPHRQNTQAVTVTLLKAKAEELLKAGSIRVGPSWQYLLSPSYFCHLK
jgi:hypothetical protein